VDDVPAPDDEERLRVAMGCDADGFDFERSRYHRVCIVADEASPIREWVTAVFRSTMPALVAAGGLFVCAPPYDPQRAEVVPLEPPTR
jgi:DNA gyrase/topoisomerase IV subunit B